MPRFSPPQGSNGSTGTATAADVLTGFTFSNSQQTGQSGSMPNNGAVTLTPSGTGAVAIPAGYHNGAGTVAQVNVPAGSVLTGTTIAGVAGTMSNRGAPTWNPGTTNQSLAAGYYSGGTVNGDASLAAGNIRSGASIFGVAGNVAPRAYANGSAVVQNTSTNLVVSGLSFTPVTVVFSNMNGQFWQSSSAGSYTPASGGIYSQHFNVGASGDTTMVHWAGTGLGEEGSGSVTISMVSGGFTLYTGLGNGSTAWWEAWG